MKSGPVRRPDHRDIPEHFASEGCTRPQTQVKLRLDFYKVARFCDRGQVNGLSNNEILHTISLKIVTNLHTVVQLDD